VRLEGSVATYLRGGALGVGSIIAVLLLRKTLEWYGQQRWLRWRCCYLEQAGISAACAMRGALPGPKWRAAASSSIAALYKYQLGRWKGRRCGRAHSEHARENRYLQWMAKRACGEASHAWALAILPRHPSAYLRLLAISAARHAALHYTATAPAAHTRQTRTCAPS